MENVSALIKLLGEENEKKIKDGITEMILDRFQSDIEDYDSWVIDFEDLYGEINREVEARVRDIVIERYTNAMIEKVSKTLDELFNK